MDKGTTDEIGKCVLTAALPKVWAREAVNSLSHSWRFGRDHPTCCKYPARRRRGGGGGLSEQVGGLPSSPWLVSYQDLDCGRSEVFAVQLERVQQGQGWWWGAFGSGLAPRDRSSHLISPRHLTIGGQKHNICFRFFSLSTL